MQTIVEYKPLTEAITISGEKFYKTCTPEQLIELRQSNEAIYFDISKQYVTSASINKWSVADPDDTMIEYETQLLTKRQKDALKLGMKNYTDRNPYKTLSKTIVMTMIERIRKGQNPDSGPSN